MDAFTGIISHFKALRLKNEIFVDLRWVDLRIWADSSDFTVNN